MHSPTTTLAAASRVTESKQTIANTEEMATTSNARRKNQKKKKKKNDKQRKNDMQRMNDREKNENLKNRRGDRIEMETKSSSGRIYIFFNVTKQQHEEITAIFKCNEQREEKTEVENAFVL